MSMLPPNMDSVLAQLSEKDEPNEIKLSIFKSNIHNFFTSDDENSGPKFWRRISGGYKRSVNVVDDNTGDIVYVVPPLIRNYDFINTLSEPGTMMIDVLREANRVMEFNPDKASDILVAGFNMKFGNQITVDEEAINTWNNILRDFGYDIGNTNLEKKDNVSYELDDGFEME